MDRRTVTRALAFVAGLAVAAIAMADTFNLFQPANGILKGNSSTYVTTAAASSDVVSLFNATSTCTSPTTEFLRADGICAVPAGSGSGSVTSVGISAPASIFSVTGSPITGAGTLTLSYAIGQTPTELFGTDGSGNVSLFALTGAYVPPINLASTSNGGITGTLGVAHGGTGATTLTTHGVLVGEGTSAITGLTALAADNVLMGVASADPTGKSVPNCGSGTQALSYSTSTHTFGCQTISAGTGTVTSVGLTAPSVFSVAGSPVTSTGTLALTFAGGQTANQFLASTSGTAGAVGLRSIVSLDLPPINLASSSNGGVTGNLPVTNLNGGTGASSSTCWFGDGTWKACGAGGGVTSVAMTTPSWLTVSGSPITGSGTLAVTGTPGEPANQFVATPGGLTGAITLRSMVANDFSSISPINWTGLNTFNGANTTSTATSGVNLGQTSNRAVVTMVDTNGTTDNHFWQILTGSSGTNLSLRAINDAQTTTGTVWSANRSAGAVTSIGIGDSTNKPAITLNGPTTISAPSSGTTLQVNALASVPGLQVSGSAGSGAPIESLLQNTNSAGYTSLRWFNDQSSNARALEMDYSGSTYTGPLLTGGPTGEAGSITTTGSFPLSIGAGNTERIRIIPSTSTVNVTGNLTVNNTAVCQANGTNCPFAATVRVASGTMTLGGGTCTINQNTGSSIGGCIRTGTGVAQVTATGFSSGSCTVSGSGAVIASAVGSLSGNTQVVDVFNFSGTAVDGQFSIVCVGQ